MPSLSLGSPLPLVQMFLDLKKKASSSVDIEGEHWRPVRKEGSKPEGDEDSYCHSDWQFYAQWWLMMISGGEHHC